MSTSVEVTSFPIMPVSLHNLLNFLLSSSFPVDFVSPNLEKLANVSSMSRVAVLDCVEAFWRKGIVTGFK